METRLLTLEDHVAAVHLGREAFGTPPGAAPPEPLTEPLPGRRTWGTFEDGRLVAKVVGRAFTSYFQGAELPTCGIAGVAVSAEHRGGGLMGTLMRRTLEDAREQGQVISTLFPTAPGIYRRLGWELVSSYDTVEIPTAALAGVRATDGTTVRRATLDDVPAVRRVYETWAREQNGPLSRTGPSFGATDADLLDAFTGTTVAEHPEHGIVGYAMWQRGAGYDAGAVLEVEDLVTLTGDAARALWQLAGGFASVTPRVRLWTSGFDTSRLALPFHAWDVVDRHTYMLRVDDVAGALSALPLTGDHSLGFSVAGDPLGTMDGGYRLEVADGRARCVRTDPVPGGPVLSPQGLALAYAGTQSARNLRFAGHLTGGDATFDATLDALLGGRQAHIRDYF